MVFLAECRGLLPHLLTLSEEHVGEAHVLQEEVEDIEQQMRNSIERIWTEREAHSSDLHEAGGPNQVRLTDKVPKPSIPDLPWKIGWIVTEAPK